MKITAIYSCAFIILILACFTPHTQGIELDDPVVDPILDSPVQEFFGEDSASALSENLGDGCCYGAALLHNGHLFNLEIVQPVYQDVEGVQLEQDWTLYASWSKAF